MSTSPSTSALPATTQTLSATQQSPHAPSGPIPVPATHPRLTAEPLADLTGTPLAVARVVLGYLPRVQTTQYDAQTIQPRFTRPVTQAESAKLREVTRKVFAAVSPGSLVAIQGAKDNKQFWAILRSTIGSSVTVEVAGLDGKSQPAWPIQQDLDPDTDQVAGGTVSVRLASDTIILVPPDGTTEAVEPGDVEYLAAGTKVIVGEQVSGHRVSKAAVLTNEQVPGHWISKAAVLTKASAEGVNLKRPVAPALLERDEFVNHGVATPTDDYKGKFPWREEWLRINDGASVVPHPFYEK